MASVKILDKFMKPVKESFNERDNCSGRRYKLGKNNWLRQK
jgi:ribosomal-protein-alanine N-acetyltransferase